MSLRAVMGACDANGLSRAQPLSCQRLKQTPAQGPALRLSGKGSGSAEHLSPALPHSLMVPRRLLLLRQRPQPVVLNTASSRHLSFGWRHGPPEFLAAPEEHSSDFELECCPATDLRLLGGLQKSQVVPSENSDLDIPLPGLFSEEVFGPKLQRARTADPLCTAPSCKPADYSEAVEISSGGTVSPRASRSARQMVGVVHDLAKVQTCSPFSCRREQRPPPWQPH
mmetsp:Transcript_126385/g.252558  ORF Transcript_126385/g.252558 Transcript_126385/m.252558 type:complete len:225 (+) Transcript_126385:717-1391(+)